MIKNAIDNAVSFATLLKCRLTGANVPLFTALGISNRCNYKCVYCYGDYFNKTERDEYFSTQELIQIIDALKGLGTRILNLIGGEPLIRSDIGTLVERVKNRKMTCVVSTNASMLPEKIDDLRNVDVIDTSLDGLEKNNDKNRGEGTFKRTIKGIECAVKNNIKTNVNMVLTKHNTGDVDEMVKLAHDTGFSLSFNIVFESHSCAHSNYADSIDIKSKEDQSIKDALRKIIDYKKEGYPIRFSETAYQYAINWPRSYSEGVYLTERTECQGFKPIKCYFPKFHCYIDTDGRMYTCLHHKDKMPDINIKEHGVKESWKKISSYRINCKTCYTICNNDANLIFSLKPSVLFSTARDML